MNKSRKRKVIVDTNCWISFLIGRKLKSLVPLLSNDKIELVLCEELLDEIRDVTNRPKFAKYFPKDEVESMLSFMRDKGEMYTPSEEIHLCRDEADDYLLALAKESNAHYMISGDKDLLVLGHIGRCKIIDVKAFESEFK